MKKTFLLLILTLCPLLAPSPSLACSVAGPNGHIGTIMAVDSQAGTLTLLDQETHLPLTLRASTRLLSILPTAIQVQVRVSRHGNTAPTLTSLSYI